MYSIRYYLDLCEDAETPVNRFLDELYGMVQGHPFNSRQVIINGNAVIEVRPDVDDRANAIHISDIMGLEAGERRGQGREALLALLRLADKHHVTLTLFAKAYAKGPGSQKFPKTKALVDWYSHYGFKRKGGQMVRLPGTPIPAPRQPTA